MDLSELCFHLRHRRLMYLPDGRYGTAIAFVEGHDSALGGAPLEGFQEYVAARTGQVGSPVHWSYLVASAVAPDEFDGSVGIGEVPVEVGVVLTDALVDLLEAFLVARGERLISDISDIRARRDVPDRRSGRAPDS